MNKTYIPGSHTDHSARVDAVSKAWTTGPRHATLGGKHRAEGYPAPTIGERTFVSIPRMPLFTEADLMVG